MSVFADLDNLLRSRVSSTNWEGTFEDYLGIVEKQPSVADLAHARVYKAIMAKGMQKINDRTRYNFFTDSIFGADDVVEQIVRYFHSAAEGLDTRRRLLLLMGPPASAKSTMVGMIKHGLEEYTRSDAGALYGIKGCPLHEEPLHLLNAEEREHLAGLGVSVEGDLCPVCLWRLDNEWGGEVLRVPVERVTISEGRRIGIGSFAPGDPKVVSLEDLVGGLDLVKVSQHGSEAHPLAFDFRGAFESASRGIMEYIEILKATPELLFPLLTLVQERQIKAGRFALFYADECVVSHTNEAEYQRFVSDGRNEAIQNRTYVIRVPYVTNYKDEVRIYQKLFRESGTRAHIAPHTLETAALFAVLSRLVPVTNIEALTKAKLYAGEQMAEHTEIEVEGWRKKGREEQGEGMDGAGPRTVMNALAQALANKEDNCLNPIDAIRALKDLPQHVVANLDAKARETLEGQLKTALNEYTEKAQEDVQKAFVEDFDTAAQTMLLNYLDNAQAFLSQSKVKDPVTGEVLPPDENLMQRIESPIHVTEATKKEFRQEILTRVGILTRKGESFRWDSHPRLKEAIEKSLFSDLSGMLKVTLTVITPDKEQREKINTVRQKLIDKYGYCPSCADAVMRFTGHCLRR